MKTLSMQLNSRRIKGLFASIVENGSMVSLAGNWEVTDRNLTLENAQGISNNYQSEGFLTKVKIQKDGSYRVLRLSRGSLADLITGFGWRMISLCFPNKVKFAGRLKLLHIFQTYCFRMYKVHGPDQVVKFLKAAQLAVQKSIGKDKINSLRDLDKSLLKSKLTGYGLPTIIPSRDRKLIASGSAPVIRFWLTLFSVYRVIDIAGNLKLQTIIAPFEGGSNYLEVRKQFYAFLKASSVSALFNVKILSKPAEPLLFEAASASHKVAWTGLVSDAKLLASLNLAHYARQVMIITGQYELILLFDFLLSSPLAEEPKDPNLRRSNTEGDPSKDRYSHVYLGEPFGFAGKLSIKEEAAGKRRVFAMTDVWTQTVLKPLEQMLAAFLKGLPNDGVYNQHASELRAREKSLRSGCSYGYDLTAATDRLPLELQSFVLNLIVPELGHVWAHLLTQRDYILKLPEEEQKRIGAHWSSKTAKAPTTYDVMGQELVLYYCYFGLTALVKERLEPWVKLRYSVGQPMGALSSFAMLAVTHHFILQFAYRLAYDIPNNLPFNKDTWYTGYECTGDDVIIFDARVAAEYKKLLAAFGMPINETKSVVATVPVTEYLKVTSYYGQNVGSISWKMLMSGNSLMGRANIIFHLLSKGVIQKNINPWIARSAALSLYKPGNLTPTLIALWTMLSNRGLLPVEECLKALISGNKKVFRVAKAILYDADVNKITLALPSLFKGKAVPFVQRRIVESIWKIEKPWFAITMWKPLAVFCAKTDVTIDAEHLTKEMLKVLLDDKYIPMIDSLSFQLDLGDFFTDGAPSLAKWQVPENQPDDLKNELVSLYTSLYTFMLAKLERLSKPIMDANPQLDSDIPSLVNLNDKLDRYNELKALVERYQIKVSGDAPAPRRNVRATELKLIKLILKMGNRPLFTTAFNL
jgi:hypothetical protein